MPLSDCCKAIKNTRKIIIRKSHEFEKDELFNFYLGVAEEGGISEPAQPPEINPNTM